MSLLRKSDIYSLSEAHLDLLIIVVAMRKNGRGERIRTSDPLVPNQVLYQAEPLPERLAGYSHKKRSWWTLPSLCELDLVYQKIAVTCLAARLLALIVWQIAPANDDVAF